MRRPRVRTLLATGLAGLVAILIVRKGGLRVPDLDTEEPELRPIEPRTRPWVGGIAQQVDHAWLHADVSELPAPRNRLHSPKAMTEAEELILRKFEEAGWAARRQPFAFANVLGFTDHTPFFLTAYRSLEGANVVAVKPGEEPDKAAVVVLGHYDTVRDSPGANDNSASVAALIELARVLTECCFRHTVVLAATDMEEIGFFGARALVSRLTRGHRVLGAINFETMAYTSDEPGTQLLPPGLGLVYREQARRIRDRELRGDFTAVVYNGPAASLASHFGAGLAHLASAHAPVLVRDPNELPAISKFLDRTRPVGKLLNMIVPVLRNFGRSDHVPFWEAGIAAIQVTDTANFRYRHYHKLTDTPEKLDYERLGAIVGAAAVAVAHAAELIAPIEK